MAIEPGTLLGDYLLRKQREDVAVRAVDAFPRRKAPGRDHDDFLPFRRLRRREDHACGLLEGRNSDELVRMDIVLAVQLALRPKDIPHPFMAMLSVSLPVTLQDHFAGLMDPELEAREEAPCVDLCRWQC